MASHNLRSALLIHPFHWPAVMLMIGYGVYWIELGFGMAARGQTTLLATVLMGIFVLVSAGWHLRGRTRRPSLPLSEKDVPLLWLVTGLLLTVSVLAVAFLAALQPPHLLQEFDTLNYHITLPRQHLIRQSFALIPWSSGDLFPLPVQFALAPYWLVTELPNKIPQFLIFLGLLGVAGRIAYFLSGRGVSVVFCVLAILGSHVIGIQMGTAMLDLALAYLLLAALDSFLRGHSILAGIEFAFYFWAKSFLPIQMIVLGGVLFAVVWAAKRWQWTVHPGLEKDVGEKLVAWRKTGLSFILASVVVGGPFVLKSLYYTGTPLFPFFPGIWPWHVIDATSIPSWEAVMASVDSHLNAKDNYGHGRSLGDAVRHLWLIAVPEKSVNNAYDYPLGLPYLLFLGPFLYLFAAQLRKKALSIAGVFIIIYWSSWWFGSQQSRFLYVPLILMFILVSAGWRRPSRWLLTGLMLALALNVLSVYRAHRHDLLRPSAEVLRPKDRETLALNEMYWKRGNQYMVQLKDHDHPYATFPFDVTQSKLPFVMDLNP